MSFAPSSGRYLETGSPPAGIYHGSLPLVIDGPNRSLGPKGILDTARFEVVVDSSLADEQLAAVGFAYDTKVVSEDGFHSMWVKSMTEDVQSPYISVFTVELIGLLAAGEKRLRKVQPVKESVTSRQGTAPDEVTVVQDYYTFSIIDTYFQENEPDYSVIGRGMTPPDATGVPGVGRPGDVATGYAVGWHLGNRVAEHLYGTLYRIEDTFAYGQYLP